MPQAKQRKPQPATPAAQRPPKVTLEAVSIEGVKVFETEETRRNRQKQFRGAIPLVTGGTVLAFDLANPSQCTTEPAPLIAQEENAVTALCVVPGRGVYGLTSGKRAHVFALPRTLEVGHLGVPFDKGTAGRALVRAYDETLVGAIHVPGEGARLFAYDAGGDMLSYYSATAVFAGKVEDLGMPFKGEDIVVLTAPGTAGMLYGLTAGALLFGYDARRRKVTFHARVAPEAVSPVLAEDGQGRLFGVGPEGYLFRYDIAAKRVEYVNARVPAQRGRHYVAGAAQLLPARDGWMYGSTRGDGYLFAFQPASGDLVNLGKPMDGELRHLAHGHGGLLYCTAGSDVQHLITYSLTTRSFEDLGVTTAWVPVHWTAHEYGAVAVGDFGEVFLGVQERLGHLMVYFPPVAR